MQIQYLFSAWSRWIFAVLILGMFAYGLVTFPDAPINPGSTGYYGRSGNLYSEAEYEHFVLWSWAYFVVFVLSIVHSMTWWSLKQKGKV